MNRRLSCDDVFDLLTRAPFPAGEDSDQGVDDHLRVCHGCRQMAEALRPATDLFREVMSDDERRRLPAYRGQLATLTRAGNASSPPAPSRTEFAAWNPVAAGGTSWQQQRYLLPALGVAMLLMAAILHGRATVGHSSTAESPITSATAISDRDTTCILAGYSLPPGCLPRSMVGPVRPRTTKPNPEPSGNQPPMNACLSCHESMQPAAAEACCTHCHAVRSQKHLAKLQNQQVFPRLAASCAQCHDSHQPGPKARS